MKNERGQMGLEMVIMIAVLVGGIAVVSAFFRSNDIFANLVSSPWKTLSGLVQNGTWGSPQDTMVQHPNAIGRLATVRGKEVK